MEGRLSDQELQSVVCSARLHEVPCICTPFWEPLHTARTLRPPRPIASIMGHTTPVKRLNPPLLPGTRGASKGREGRARSARPRARERGTRGSHAPLLSTCSARCQSAPQDSRSGVWGAGARQVRGSRTGQIHEVITGMDRNSQPQQGLVWSKWSPGGA